LARNQKKSQPDRLTSGGIIFFFFFFQRAYCSDSQSLPATATTRLFSSFKPCILNRTMRTLNSLFLFLHLLGHGLLLRVGNLSDVTNKS
jgi:hypothetical protein